MLRLRRELLILVVINLLYVLRHALVEIVWSQSASYSFVMRLIELDLALQVRCFGRALEANLLVNLSEASFLEGLAMINDASGEHPGLREDPESGGPPRQEDMTS